MMPSSPTERPIAERPDVLSSEVRALKQEVARLKKRAIWGAWWIGANSLVTVALLGLIATDSVFMTRTSSFDPGDSPPGPTSEERPAASSKTGGVRAADESDPDYGESLLLSLRKRANVKKANAKKGTRWYDALPRNQREAVLLLSLTEAAAAGDIEKVVRDGFGGEVRSLINTLDNDVKTATSRIVAEDLRELLPFLPAGPVFRASGKTVASKEDWQGPVDERRDLVKRLNDELKPLAPELRKDVAHFFYWRWKMEGETFWD